MRYPDIIRMLSPPLAGPDSLRSSVMKLSSKKFARLKKPMRAPVTPRTIVPKEAESKLPQLHLDPPSEHTEEGQLAVDVFQTPEEIVLVAPIAGVSKQDITINITDDVLHIRGKRGFSWNVPKEDYFHQECFWGNFERSIILPDAIDLRKVKATFKNGILTVRVPKVEKLRSRDIEIKEE